jgi:mRNA deadenylase 3'-5' endonuclease subunit Ccr4
VSYNVLAEIYATGMVYPYCPSWALSSAYRSRLVLRELASTDADIICLQEVQKDHFDATFEPELKKLGYLGLYKQKNRLSMGMEGKVDGCATFFKSSRFELVEKSILDFNAAVKQCFDGEASKADSMPPAEASAFLNHIRSAQRRLTHDNIAQVNVLQMTTTPQGARLRDPVRFCVANTHLFWDPEYGDVKLWQTHKLLGELEKSITMPHNYPLILCGDFNSEAASAVYALLSGNFKAGRRIGLAPAQLPPDPLRVLSQGGTHLSHSIFLASAYGEVLGAEPSYTNVTESYVGCLDYIWCTASNITPLAVMAMPTREELREPWKTALPNPQHPSDHLPLVSDLLIGQPHAPQSMMSAISAAAATRAGSSAFGSAGGRGAGASMMGGPSLPVPSAEMGGIPHMGLGSHMHQARPGQRAASGAGGASGVGGLGGLGLGGPGGMPADGMWFSQPSRQAGGAGGGGGGGGGGLELTGGQFGVGLAGLGASPQRMAPGRDGGGHSGMGGGRMM